MWTEESARVFDFRLAKGNLSFWFYFSVSSILFVSHKRLYSPSSLMFIMICESTLVQTKFSSTIIFFVVFTIVVNALRICTLFDTKLTWNLIIYEHVSQCNIVSL